MPKMGVLTKILAAAGVALTWLPVAAMLLTALFGLFRERVLRLDYLMPAELFPFALAGGGLLVGAALRARARRGLIAGGLAVAATALVAGQALAVVSGLASGEIEPAGVWWALVVASLVIYTAAVVELGVVGVVLAREVFGPAAGRGRDENAAD